MTKLLLPVAILFLFASCTKEKEYSCKCNSQVTDANTGEKTTITQGAYFITKNKAEANTKCQEKGVSVNSVYTGVGIAATTSCVIE
jgi:hypothetical protein